MARPPSSGMGSRWTLRGPGRSTMPTRKANSRTGRVRASDEIKAMANASKPGMGIAPMLSLRQHAIEDRSNMFAVFRLVIPINGAFEPFAEHHLWLPAHQLPRARVVRHAVERPGRHAGEQFHLGLVTGHFHDHVDRVQDANALHGAEIHGRAVVNLFGRAD